MDTTEKGINELEDRGILPEYKSKGKRKSNRGKLKDGH